MLLDTFSLQPVNLVQLLLAFVCLFGTALIWPNPRMAGLKVLLPLTTLLMLLNILEETRVIDFYLFTPVFTLAMGPAFYLFVNRLVNPQGGLGWRTTGHFVPAALALGFTQQPQVVIALGSVSQIIYAIAAVRLVRRYHRASFATRADAENTKLSWLYLILLLFIFLGGTDLVRQNLQPHLSYSILNHWYLLHLTLVLWLYVWLVYKTVSKPELFDGVQEYESWAEQDTLNVDQAYREQAKAVFKQLEELIAANSLYKIPRLTLQDLAKQTGLSERDISWAINQGAGCNFCDFINGHRVEAVKQALAMRLDRQQTLLDLALASGFNSKSSFNAVFKRFTGSTPSQYQASLEDLT